MAKCCVLHRSLLCDPKLSEKCTKLTKFLVFVETLWNPVKGLDSLDFTFGLAKAQWRCQVHQLEARGLWEHHFLSMPCPGNSRKHGRPEDSHRL